MTLIQFGIAWFLAAWIFIPIWAAVMQVHSAGGDE